MSKNLYFIVYLITLITLITLSSCSKLSTSYSPQKKDVKKTLKNFYFSKRKIFTETDKAWVSAFPKLINDANISDADISTFYGKVVFIYELKFIIEYIYEYAEANQLDTETNMIDILVKLLKDRPDSKSFIISIMESSYYHKNTSFTVLNFYHFLTNTYKGLELKFYLIIRRGLEDILNFDFIELEEKNKEMNITNNADLFMSKRLTNECKEII